MFNTPYSYNPQPSIDRINGQIAELEKMKTQLQQSGGQLGGITQNFQLAPTNRETIRYASSMDEVKREMVLGDTPFFSKDMSVVWVKNAKGEIKSYELNEIVERDEKDLKIDFLMAQIEELRKEVNNAKSNDTNANEPTENQTTTSVPTTTKPNARKK